MGVGWAEVSLGHEPRHSTVRFLTHRFRVAKPKPVKFVSLRPTNLTKTPLF